MLKLFDSDGFDDDTKLDIRITEYDMRSGLMMTEIIEAKIRQEIILEINKIVGIVSLDHFQKPNPQTYE